MGENTITRTRGIKVKSPFQRTTHDTCHFYVGLHLKILYFGYLV